MENIAEKGILGTLIKNPYLLSDTELVVEHFSSGIHKNIFQAIKNAINDFKTCDMITLLSTNPPETLGGASYLTELQNFNNENRFDKYVEIVLSKWRESKKHNILEIAHNENWSIEEITNALDQLTISKVDDHMCIDDFILRDAERPYIETIENPGAPTGIRDFDLATNGLQDGELIIIAARPSMGKSDVMLKIADSAGKSGRYVPHIFSLEMPGNLLFDRLVASTAGYDRSKMRNPYKRLRNEEKTRWMPSLGSLSKTKIQIFDSPRQKVSVIRNKVRKSMASFPELKPIILIDYLTLIRPEKETGNRHQEVGDITKSLKAMAKEFSCPVVCLAQLSRSVEQRQDKRPMLSDLRESGSIEEDGDVIAFLYREDYYDAETENANTLEIIIAKQRNGAVGTVKSAYQKSTGRIIDMDWGQQNGNH